MHKIRTAAGDPRTGPKDQTHTPAENHLEFDRLEVQFQWIEVLVIEFDRKSF